jgi:hypothetical protein
VIMVDRREREREIFVSYRLTVMRLLHIEIAIYDDSCNVICDVMR